MNITTRHAGEATILELSGDITPHRHFGDAKHAGCIPQMHDVMFGERVGKRAQPVGFGHEVGGSAERGCNRRQPSAPPSVRFVSCV